MEIVQEKWDDILSTMKTEYDLSDVSYKTWVEPLHIYKIEGDTIYILPKDDAQPFTINYIKKKYEDLLKVTIADFTGKEYNLEFILPKSVETEVQTPVARNSGLNPKYTFDSFVVGNNNKFAQNAALAVAETPGEAYNPLYIYGGPGLGKTHLMHAIGNYILTENPDKKVLYVTSEEFLNEVIESLRSTNNATAMTKFRNKYRAVDVLMIDDIQFIIGKESTQEEFFHTFNTLHSAGKQIILTSDRPPKEMKTLKDRIRSRFEWQILVIRIMKLEWQLSVIKLIQNISIYPRKFFSISVRISNPIFVKLKVL